MGKLVVKLIRSGGRLVSKGIQAARERSHNKDLEYTSSPPRSPNTITGEQNGHFYLADEEIARGLVNEGRAELPASHEQPIHYQCAELPAVDESFIHRDYAELPSVPIEPQHQQSHYIQPPYPVDQKTHNITIQPSPSHGYTQSSYPVEITHDRLPTYEESEWAPVAFSAAENPSDQQRRSMDRAAIPQMVDPGVDALLVPRPLNIPRCSCGDNIRA